MTARAAGARTGARALRSLTAAALARLSHEERLRAFEGLGEAERETVRRHWPFWAMPGQMPPPGDWRTWLLMAGRGYGKTRCGAEWVRSVAEADGRARIALVAATLGEARAVMVEGPSGLLAIAPSARRPRWEPSLRRLRWPGGAVALVYGASEPDALRGRSTATPGATRSRNGRTGRRRGTIWRWA